MGPARAQDSGDLFADLPSVDPTSGIQIEQVLAVVGMDAAWRSATDLNEITRTMSVQYRAGDLDTVNQLLTVAATIDSTRAQHERISARVRSAADELARAAELERRHRIDRNRAAAHLEGMEALVRSVAVDLFAGSGDTDDDLLGSDGQALLHAQRTMELRGHTLDEMLERRAWAIDALARANARLTDSIRQLNVAHEDQARLSAEMLAVVRSLRTFENDARTLLPQAAEAFVLAQVPREPNLTVRALDAYIDAELAYTEIDPRCRISWRTIAAIGAVEGAHATYGGRTIGLDGRPNEPIVGLPLDGETVDNYGEPVAEIPDTDDGKYDDDTEFDRAVGPMQFIPQTWERWGHDADGDGDDEPQDLDDAALSAAAYLCNYGSQRDWENWKSAVFGYNHSAHYVASVKSAHERLQRVRIPTVDGVDLWPGQPWGTYVPMPLPEPEPEEVVDAAALAGSDG